MSSLGDRQLDEVILSIPDAAWRKVAVVIIKVADAIGSEVPEADAGYNLVATRIEVLVRGGRLLAQGDITKWRDSEIGKPS
jgi:hypothetical protein